MVRIRACLETFDVPSDHVHFARKKRAARRRGAQRDPPRRSVMPAVANKSSERSPSEIRRGASEFGSRRSACTQRQVAPIAEIRRGQPNQFAGRGPAIARGVSQPMLGALRATPARE